MLIFFSEICNLVRRELAFSLEVDKHRWKHRCIDVLQFFRNIDVFWRQSMFLSHHQIRETVQNPYVIDVFHLFPGGYFSLTLSLSLTFAYAKNGMTVDSYGTIDYYYFFTDTYGCLRLLTRKTETETLFTIILLHYTFFSG